MTPKNHHSSAVMHKKFSIGLVEDSWRSRNEANTDRVFLRVEQTILTITMVGQKRRMFLKQPWYGGRLNCQFTLLLWLLSLWVFHFKNLSSKLILCINMDKNSLFLANNKRHHNSLKIDVVYYAFGNLIFDGFLTYTSLIQYGLNNTHFISLLFILVFGNR